MTSLSPRSIPSGALRPRRSRFSSVLLVGALLAVGACDEDTPTDPVVVSAVEVTPRLSTARVGATQQLTATAKDVSGNPMSGEVITWRSSEPSVATVSATGLVTYVGAGSTAILASARGTSGFATIVSDANVSSIEMSVATLSVPMPQSRQLYATARDANGVALFRPVTWTTSAAAIATVSATGLVTSVSAGTATITATSEGKSASTTVTVVPPAPVATVTFSPNTGFLPTTVGVPITVTLRDADGGVLANRIITFSSSDQAIATVSATGVVTAQAPGSVTITVTSEGRSATATFTALTGVLSGAAAVLVENAAESDNPFVAFKQYAIYVPTGSTSLVVRLANGTGDPDLYLFAPGNTALDGSWVCRSWNGGPGETCTMPNPAPGVWRIIVDSYNKHTGTSLTATITPTPP